MTVTLALYCVTIKKEKKYFFFSVMDFYIKGANVLYFYTGIMSFLYLFKNTYLTYKIQYNIIFYLQGKST